MKLTIFTLVLSIISLTVYSQSFSQIKTDPLGVGVIYHTFNNNDKFIDGNPNYNKKWQKGIVSTGTEGRYEIDSMHYNIYLGKVLFVKEGTIYTFPTYLKITKFKMGNNIFESLSVEKNTTAFFQVLSENSKKSLLKRYHCNFIEGKPSNGMLPASEPKYITNSEYYIKNKNGVASKLKVKKNDVLKVMEDEFLKVETYIKENNIKLKNENDLIKVFEYYSHLL